MNISNFMSWFIQQVFNIGSTMLGKLDQIIITGNVSLMDFIITIAILSTFITLIITAPNLGVVNRALNARDRQIRNKEKGK